MSMPPILVAHLFPAVSGCLVELLRSLPPAAWELPTLSSRRTVKDIVSHLLDGNFRRLSLQRDGYRPDERGQPRPGEPLMAFLNRLNDEWETATRRLSPRVLIDLIETVDPQFARFMQALDPHAPAIFPVAWAGEEQSQNWMDIAREYTEKWHHTQQIFAATGQPSTILTKRLGQPCLDIFLRALPFTFRDVQTDVGSVVAVEVTGEAGGRWYVERGAAGWHQVAETTGPATATVTLDQDTAWKLVTKRRSLAVVRELFPGIQIAGDAQLGSHVLRMVSVMA